eukprot:6781836-Prymnesium_polylepis.1
MPVKVIAAEATSAFRCSSVPDAVVEHAALPVERCLLLRFVGVLARLRLFHALPDECRLLGLPCLSLRFDERVDVAGWRIAQRLSYSRSGGGGGGGRGGGRSRRG